MTVVINHLYFTSRDNRPATWKAVAVVVWNINSCTSYDNSKGQLDLDSLILGFALDVPSDLNLLGAFTEESRDSADDVGRTLTSLSGARSRARNPSASCLSVSAPALSSATAVAPSQRGKR
jgi:hypothetical protein